MNNEKKYNKCLINWVKTDKDPNSREKVAIYDDEDVLKVIDGKKGEEIEKHFGCTLGELWVNKYIEMDEHNIRIQYMVMKDNDKEHEPFIIDDGRNMAYKILTEEEAKKILNGGQDV